MRINIDVPYEDKELAKRLGARWDSEARTWDLEQSTPLSKIMAWLPADRRPEEPGASTTFTVADAWRMLPPRHTNPHTLFAYVSPPDRPARLKRGGFCHYCDSRTNDWMLNNTELWHMASIEWGVIRPSEAEIISQALDAGVLPKRGYALEKVLRIFARFPR